MASDIGRHRRPYPGCARVAVEAQGHYKHPQSIPKVPAALNHTVPEVSSGWPRTWGVIAVPILDVPESSLERRISIIIPSASPKSLWS